MKFKYPGADVATCTVIWVLLGLAALGMAAVTGRMPWYVAACAVVAVPAVGMWFQVRPAGYLFGACNAMLGLVGLFALVAGGVSLNTALRTAATLYAAWVSFQWARSVDQQPAA